MSDALACGTCGGATIVTDSRPHRGMDGIRRRRACTDCGLRFTTIELRADDSFKHIIEGELKSLRNDIIDRVDRVERVIWGAEPV